MASQCLNFSILLAMALLVLATEAEIVHSDAANATGVRDARQVVLLYPNHGQFQKELNAPTMYDDAEALAHPYGQQLITPRRFAQQGTLGTSNADERFFGGLSSLITGRPLCPTCPSCPNCPSCAVCPTCTACAVCAAPCPGTTNAATPIAINIPIAGACATSAIADLTLFFGTCSRMSAAPTGVFTVTAVAQPAAGATTFMGIMTTCPNNRVTLTCGTVPAGFTVSTQTGASLTAAGTLVENGFMQVFVRVLPAAAAGAAVSCSWSSSP